MTRASRSLSREAEAEAALADGTIDELLRRARRPGRARPDVQRVEPSGGRASASTPRSASAAQDELLARTLRAALLVGQPACRRDVVSGSLAPVQVTHRHGRAATTVSDVRHGRLVPAAHSSFTLLFVISIFITSGYLLQSVTEEKENRVVEIVLSSVPSLPLMAGKILGLGAAGLTQVAIWLVTALVAIPLIGDRFGDAGRRHA